MKDFCIVSDFDGTISDKDSLYAFISTYAKDGWQKIEEDWVKGDISSKECLIEEFKLIPDLSEELISEFIKNIGIDKYFKNFYKYITENNIDFYVVSDGIDYFIKRIFEKYDLNNIKVISNHGTFRGEFFEITFPNDNPECINNAGTCKCSVLARLKEKYNKIYYIGDGVSDYCVADKPDILFAKSRLLTHCKTKGIKYVEFDTFKDVTDYFCKL